MLRHDGGRLIKRMGKARLRVRLNALPRFFVEGRVTGEPLTNGVMFWKSRAVPKSLAVNRDMSD